MFFTKLYLSVIHKSELSLSKGYYGRIVWAGLLRELG